MPEDPVRPPPVPLLPQPWRLRLVDPGGPDLDLVYRWMRTPRVVEGFGQPWDRERWIGDLGEQLRGDHSRPCLVDDGQLTFAYLELYRVWLDVLRDYYPARPHDLGVHLVIGEPSYAGRGVGTALLRAVTDGLFAADARCTRIVAEPNATNLASIRAFTKAGFHLVGPISLPGRDAALLIRERTAPE